MADVLLLHHALGVTPGIDEFARTLRAEGHRVEVPDLYEGVVFSTTNDGVAHANQVGFDTLIERGVAAADGLGERLVVIGFSLGVMPAQKIAQTRPGVLGAVLCHGAVPVATFGDGWPDQVAVQLHLGEEDPWAQEDMEAAQEVASSATDGQLFLYPGAGHLIADSSHPDYDEKLANQLVERTIEFLAGIS